jgi:Ca2+-binding EF-hand superfamily protein
MLKLLIGVAAVALAGASSTAAQPSLPAPTSSTQPGIPSSAPTGERVHMRMIGDRVMTRDEVVAHVQKLFARLDTNRDGFITREEAAAAAKVRMHRRLATADRPMPDREAMFARLDTNKDGMISRDEYMSARPEIRQQRIVVRNQGGPRAAGEAMHDMRHQGMMGHLFEMADTDRDGRVSLVEATNAAAHHFDQMDLNRDGKITPEERHQAHQQMRAQRRG